MTEKKGTATPIIFFILIFCAIVFSFGCKGQPSEKKEFKGQREPVTIGVATLLLSAPVIIAQEKGYFADEGLDVSIKTYPYGKIALEAMFANKVDLATVAETPIVINIFKRDDFLVIAMFAYSYVDLSIFVYKDSGIKNAGDLKGKKIGVTTKTASEFFLDSYLNYNNVKLSDVKIFNIPINDLPAALNRREYDAIVVAEPYCYETFKLMKDKVRRMPKADVFPIAFNLTAMKDFHKNNPETIKKVLKAIDKAVTFIKQNEKESIALLAKTLNMEEKYLHDNWDDYVFDLSLDQSLLITFEDVARWSIRNKLTDKTRVPNYLNYFDFASLSSVKPEAVKIIH
jgi:NitT/TauT family transport system substrate-binding protein